MKKLAFIAVLSAAASTHVLAADGTITIEGMVTDKTCDITTPAGKSFTVNLPTVSKSTLANAGDVAGRTPFTINLAKCSAGKVATFFEPGSTVDFKTGRLQNHATGESVAKNVDVQLLGSNNQVIKVIQGTDKGAQVNSQWVDVKEQGTADLNYYAEYFANAAATAGKVTASVQYTIIYQ